ncbi:hypothetical protein DPV78_004575 [Talaromyces pinophilus]|nr:hypothetical protein DPV78_004575 [Talaromyces pinophilus]
MKGVFATGKRPPCLNGVDMDVDQFVMLAQSTWKHEPDNIRLSRRTPKRKQLKKRISVRRRGGP